MPYINVCNLSNKKKTKLQIVPFFTRNTVKLTNITFDDDLLYDALFKLVEIITIL